MFAAGTNWVTLTVELLPHWIQGLMYLKTVHVFTLQFVFFLIYAFYIRYCEKSLFPALTFELKFWFLLPLHAMGTWQMERICKVGISVSAALKRERESSCIEISAPLQIASMFTFSMKYPLTFSLWSSSHISATTTKNCTYHNTPGCIVDSFLCRDGVGGWKSSSSCVLFVW